MATLLVPPGIHMATSQQAAGVGAVRHCMLAPRMSKAAHCRCGAILQNTPSHGLIPIRHESSRGGTNINRLCPRHGETRKRASLCPAQSGRLYSREISFVLGLCSECVMLAASWNEALNCLVDQAVFGNQPVPRHFAAVKSTKHCTVSLMKPRKSECSAVHRAVSFVRVLVRVLPRWTLSKFPVHLRFG